MRAVCDVEVAALPLPPRMRKALEREGLTRVSEIYRGIYLSFIGDKTLAETSAVLVAAGFPPLKFRDSFLASRDNAAAWAAIFPALHICLGG